MSPFANFLTYISKRVNIAKPKTEQYNKIDRC